MPICAAPAEPDHHGGSLKSVWTARRVAPRQAWWCRPPRVVGPRRTDQPVAVAPPAIEPAFFGSGHGQCAPRGEGHQAPSCRLVVLRARGGGVPADDAAYGSVVPAAWVPRPDGHRRGSGDAAGAGEAAANTADGWERRRRASRGSGRVPPALGTAALTARRRCAGRAHLRPSAPRSARRAPLRTYHSVALASSARDPAIGAAWPIRRSSRIP